MSPFFVWARLVCVFLCYSRWSESKNGQSEWRRVDGEQRRVVLRVAEEKAEEKEALTAMGKGPFIGDNEMMSLDCAPGWPCCRRRLGLATTANARRVVQTLCPRRLPCGVLGGFKPTHPHCSPWVGPISLNQMLFQYFKQPPIFKLRNPIFTSSKLYENLQGGSLHYKEQLSFWK
jgi:hypothetical protein